MDECKTVERRKDHVHFPINIPQQWRYSVGKNAIPEPVAGGGERHGFGSDLGWVDLSGICPRAGTPSDGEGTDEEIRTSYNCRRYGSVIEHNPSDVGICGIIGFGRVGFTVSGLERT